MISNFFAEISFVLSRLLAFSRIFRNGLFKRNQARFSLFNQNFRLLAKIKLLTLKDLEGRLLEQDGGAQLSCFAVLGSKGEAGLLRNERLASLDQWGLICRLCIFCVA